MHQDTVPPTSCACTALRTAARAISRVYDEALAGAGLTTTQLAILRMLALRGASPLSRLAEQLVMDRTSLYRALGPIERRGWITIAGSARGRSKQAALSEAGRAVLADAAAPWQAAQARFVAAVGGPAWESLRAALAEVTAFAAPGGADRAA